MTSAELEDRIDPRQALASLGYAEAGEPVRVKGGWDTLLWRFVTADGAEHSLRVYSPHLPEGTPWRERLALETCAKAGLPAPRIEVSGEVEGLPAVVLSWCPGLPILSFVEKKPWLLWRVGRLFGRMQARIHAVPPPPEFTEGAPDYWVRRVSEENADLAVHASSLGLITSSLIHMDYHPLNLVSDGSTVTGVLDWAYSAAGDPRADLARTEVTILTAPIPPGPMKPFLNLARRLILRSWRSGYQQEAGRLPEFRSLRAWAAATLLAETEAVLGRPGVWATQETLQTFRRAVDVWALEEGIRGSPS